MVSRAGLALNPGQMADLVLAWRQLLQLLSRISRDRPLADDLAYAFHVPPARPGRPRPGGDRGVTASRRKTPARGR